MVEITVKPEDAWDFFKDQVKTLVHSYIPIAQADGGVTILMGVEYSGMPNIIVMVEGDVVMEELATGKEDLADTLEYIYSVYASDRGYATGLSDEPEFDEEDVIEDRERELDMAFDALLEIVVEHQYDLMMTYEDVIEDLKDLVCERLARKYNLDIYRPMILVDEDGEEFFEEYPYSVMIYDDEQDEPVKKGA